MHLIDDEHQPTPVIVQIEDLPLLPDLQMREPLEHFLRSLVAESPGSVAFLLTRPGRSGITVGERRWAQVLSEVSRRAGLRPWPVHRANDDELVVVAPDDLAASA